jgi:hypothetical protein
MVLFGLVSPPDDVGLDKFISFMPAQTGAPTSHWWSFSVVEHLLINLENFFIRDNLENYKQCVF